ncbi:MAG: bifunctional 4-hydroxy-2-oxoglutarate aldolase/2-dehydro-3-deoxy-phosphogluconate aldolase [Sarcina sp.]
MITKFKDLGIVAVIRGKNHQEAENYVKASIDGGIKAIELTYSIPEMPKLLKRLKSEHKEGYFGAGSVLNTQMAIDAIAAGAEYIVSPGYISGVNEICKKEEIAYAPGCMTITEMLNAKEEGVELIKMFPGNLFGPSFVKAVKAPIPDINIMPTGGVDIDNVQEWFKSGVTCVGVGSSLLESQDYDTIKKLASRFVEKIDEYKRSYK